MAGGLRERLRTAALRPIRHWLRVGTDAELDVRWIGVAGLELRLGAAELNAEAIGREALQSAPVALRRATVRGARLAVSLVGAPAVVLVVEGLHVEVSPRCLWAAVPDCEVLNSRPVDDDYWKEVMLERKEQERIKKLAAIDPEGAAEHSRAEKQANKDQSNGFLARLLASFLLSAVRLELHDAKIILHSVSQDHQAALSAEDLIIREGSEQSIFKGSLIGAAANFVVNARKNTISTKPCSVSQLSLRFETHVQRTNPVMERTGSPGGQSQPSPLNREHDQHAVLVVMLLLTCRFHRELFAELEMHVPEAVFGLHSGELDVLMTMLAELQGPPIRLISNSGCIEQCLPGRRSAKELWTRAIAKAIGISPRCRLSRTLQAGFLRRRYASLYGDWLQKTGWRRKEKEIVRSDSLQRLSAAVAEIEKQLPVEAVALARLISRRQRLAMLLSEPVENNRNMRNENTGLNVFLRKMRSLLPLRKTGYEDAADVEEPAKAQENGTLRSVETFSLSISRGSVIFGAYNDNAESGGGVAVCIRWKKASIAYGSTAHVLGYSFVCGSLLAEVVSLATQDSTCLEQRDSECRGRWDDKVVDKFVFFSSSALQSSQGSSNGNIMKSYSTHVQVTHVALKDQETGNWVSKPWKCLDEQVEVQESLDSLQVPFLVAVYQNPLGGYIGEPQESCGSMLAVGRADFVLKSSLFSQIFPLLCQLKKVQDAGSPSTKSRSMVNSSKLDIIYKEHVSLCLNTLRNLAFSIIPDKCLQFSAAIEDVRVVLLGSDAELLGQKVDSSTMPTLILDLGYFEFAIWPATSKDVGGEADPASIKKLGTQHAALFEKKEWIRRPPLPTLPTLDRYLEHDQFGNNFIVCMEGASVTIQRRNAATENLVEPFTITFESSFCRDHFSSLFDTFKSVSVAALLNIPTFIVDLCFDRTTSLLQVAFCYINAAMGLISNFSDSSGVAELPGISEGETQKSNSEESGVKCFALCLNVTLGNFKVYVGNSEYVEKNQHARSVNENGQDGMRAGLFTVESLWFYCTLGDGSCLSIWSGLQKIQLCLVDIKIMKQFKLKLPELEQCRDLQDSTSSRSRKLVTDKFFADHLIVTFCGPATEIGATDGNENQMTSCIQNESGKPCSDIHGDFYCSIEVDVGTVLVAGCPLENLMTRARQCSPTAENMRILLAVEKDVQKCVIEITGGLFVFHTTALVGIINFAGRYAEYSSELLVLLKSSEGDPIVNEERQDTFTRLDRSFSLPEGRQFDKHGLLPVRSQSNPQQILESNHELFAEGILSSKVSGLSLVLATAGDSPGRPVEGVLLDVSATSSMEAQRSSCKIIADVNQFTVISLQSQLNPDLNGTPTNRIPQFGFLHTEPESSEGVKEISSTDSKGTASSGVNAPTEVSRLDYIVECLAVSSSLSRRSTRDMDLNYNNYWQGHISVTGFDVALTTYEVQTLLSIVTPFANISFASGGTTKETYTNSGHTIERGSSAGIPDGSIVAIKDAQEHLYLSVEENPTSKGQYHLAGVWHYSVAGERALFKVKYHDGNKGDDRSAWFSLSSLHAKNSAGVPLRVHYRPGSRQVEVSSTNDGSWELWQCIPYRSAEDAAGEFDVYSGIFSDLVHLINQKSKQGLAFVDGIPTVVSRPGNSFKVKVVGQPAEIHSFLMRGTLSKNQTNRTELAAPPSVTAIPEVRCDMGSIYVTLLHEAAGAVHLLPLIRMRLEEVQGLAQVSSRKTRIIAGCSLVLEHFEAQSSSWLSIVNPVVTDIVCSSRTGKPADGYRKIPTSLFCKLKKVDFVVSELSLDACLFLIGVMDLAGPYTIKYSPVLVNRCKIENQTGVNLFCRFDREGGGEEEGKIPAWQSNSYLMRHVTSRRGTTPAQVSTSVAISLEKPGKGLSSAVNLRLSEPGVLAVRTRLEAFEGSRVNAPGPIVVLDVSRQSQDGIYLTVSPMVKIHNATGLALQLRCRRPKQGEEGGAIVSLKDGDIIDDSMGAFDALSLEGEMKKALLSFNVGNFLLSIRPENFESQKGATYDWSEDVKGAKAVRVSGLFEKLNYSIKKTLKSKSLESSFGSVLCKASSAAESENESASGLHFLIRTTRRQVPVTRLTNDNQQNRSLVAWQEQQELLLLPTLRVFNFLSTTVHVQVTTSPGDKGNAIQRANEVTIPGSGGKAPLYADLSALFLVIKDGQGLLSNPVDISTGHKRFQELAKKGGSIKDLDIEIIFNDGVHVAILKVYRADDGVLELVIFTKYVLQNDSQVPIICCAAKGSSRWQGRRSQNLQWPPSAPTISLHPGSPVSWFHKSNNLLMKRQEEGAYPAALDLDALSGSVEISLGVESISSVDKIQLGVRLQVPAQADSDPSHFIRFSPRYTVVNESAQPICVCQDGFEDDENKSVVVAPAAQAAVHAQILEGRDESFHAGAEGAGKDTSALTLRFRFKKNGWRWSGRVCAASLGSFFLKLRRDSTADEFHGHGAVEQEKMQFAVLHVEEEAASLIMHFRLHSKEAVPYRIENRLHSGSITFHQKGMTEPEPLLPNSSMDYVWDDLSLPHRLVVALAGTQASSEVNIDKIKAWKSFAAAHRNKGFSLQFPFQGQLGIIGLNDRDQSDDLLDTGYEVYADGQTRVLRVCQKVDSTKKNYWQSEMSIPQLKVELKVPIFRIHIVETPKQKIEDLTGEELAGNSSPFTPFLCGVLTSLSTDIIVTSEYTFCQSRIQSLGVDIKWQGAPFSAMLRVHDQDRLNKTTTVLHAAFVLSNTAANPIQVKYSSLLLQAFDLNIDEDTLMKLVPFYRTSLSTSSSSRQIYFERFEIHPIKIVASFVPGRPRADYTSAQETFRGLLHTAIKLPSVRGATVELNGVLLSHALLTFRQLAMKCVQHYSWYAMRAIYIARGSKLLPPGFASLFDDSAASSLDVFFDPSNGSIDLQGLTLGMFNLLSRGLRKKGQGGTSRYLGDLEKTVKKAGSNLVFAVVTEISDNVLKGAETNGFDGMVNGFRRGILNFAMEPSVLQKAVVRGGSTKRIQLDRSVGTDEAYIEGYLQATLDALFKQDYLKVKVMEDQVILKNLPPNSMLMNDIITCVKDFLIGEGLLAGETSLAAVKSMRILRREQERKLVPAVISLSEQLMVIFIVRGLRQYTRKIFHMHGPYSKAEMATSVNQETTKMVPVPPSQPQRPSFKRTVGNFCISSLVAYLDGRLCRHIPNEFARRIVSGFLLSFVE